MKKLFIIFMLLLAVNSFALDIIDFEMSVELGIIPKGHWMMYDNGRNDLYTKMSFYGDFNLESQLFNNTMYLGFGSKIYLWKIKDSYQFNADAIDFIFSAGVNITSNITVGYEHRCFHPIQPWNHGFKTPVWEQTYDKIYMRIIFGWKE